VVELINKLNKLGYTKIEVLVIVVLLGIVAFVTINKTSYAFAIDNSKAINEMKNLIEMQAEDYAMDNVETLFEETNTIFINVNKLIETGYLIANDEGLITSPVDSEKSYNDSKIKLEYNQEKNKVQATLNDYLSLGEKNS